MTHPGIFCAREQKFKKYYWKEKKQYGHFVTPRETKFVLKF